MCLQASTTFAQFCLEVNFFFSVFQLWEMSKCAFHISSYSWKDHQVYTEKEMSGNKGRDRGEYILLATSTSCFCSICCNLALCFFGFYWGFFSLDMLFSFIFFSWHCHHGLCTEVNPWNGNQPVRTQTAQLPHLLPLLLLPNQSQRKNLRTKLFWLDILLCYKLFHACFSNNMANNCITQFMSIL